MSEPAHDILVDARGHHCPVPTLRLRRAVQDARPGSVVKLMADDPMARIDVPHFAQEKSLDLIHRGEDGAVLSFWIRTPA